MKKGVLENFAKFTGKHLWFAKFSKRPFLQNTSGRVLLFLAFQKQPPEVLYEKRCSWKFPKIHRKTPLVCEIFKNTFFTEHLRTTASAFSFSEAATGGVLWKKVFLKISKNWPAMRVEVFYEKVVLKDFLNVIRKHLCWILFNKVVDLAPILKNIFQRLLLHCTCTTHSYHEVIHFTFTFFLIITINFSNVCFWFKLKRLQRIRSSHQSCFTTKGVLRNFAKFTGKQLCQNLFSFLTKLQAWDLQLY